MQGKHLTLWWDGFPSELRQKARPTGEKSNITKADYAGPESCKECHKANYDSWAKHPHRWMNALATPDTVKGDFSGAVMHYRGGTATFTREGDQFFMRLERGNIKRTYRVNQTIGSRYFQYYIGKQIEGPEPKSHHFYSKNHVLFLGYWLDQKEWVPIVHVGPERPENQRPDPFEPPDFGRHYAEYAVGCNYCHTTFALADMFDRAPDQMGEHAPVTLHWSMRDFLEQKHPEMVQPVTAMVERKSGKNPMSSWEAAEYGVTLGVSCEACHLGSREHVASGGQTPPRFFPANPLLLAENQDRPLEFGRTHDNVNWACGRCHTGRRPQFAAGMATWNSTEYSDAMRGSCYSKLRCVDCHNPHRATGPKWSLTPEQDDNLCLKCHDKFKAAEPRAQHTHHPAGSEGGRCMNCHMPRINEGLEDCVRTHMIYSPTRADMIEANHPNACNLCHTEKPIDWTLGYLKDWYGKSYDEAKISAKYPDRSLPVGVGWMKSDEFAVRLVATEALTRGKKYEAMLQLLDALDDPYLLNRQLAYKGLQEMLHVRLADFGYRFYMSKEERAKPLAELRQRFSNAHGPVQP
jgi:predicted CXXCH cytochrome family protein